MRMYAANYTGQRWDQAGVRPDWLTDQDLKFATAGLLICRKDSQILNGFQHPASSPRFLTNSFFKIAPGVYKTAEQCDAGPIFDRL